MPEEVEVGVEEVEVDVAFKRLWPRVEVLSWETWDQNISKSHFTRLLTETIWYSSIKPFFEPANRHSIERMKAAMAHAMGKRAVKRIVEVVRNVQSCWC